MRNILEDNLMDFDRQNCILVDKMVDKKNKGFNTYHQNAEILDFTYCSRGDLNPYPETRTRSLV